jgi:peptidoglycan/xylan/chitin deacetylase (PgdA/CDA1 family)
VGVSVIVKNWLKAALFHTGAARIVHRVRNRAVLTVVMFHRVLDKDDPRYAGANPQYTVTQQEFAVALAFFRRWYSIVSLEQVEAAIAGAALPPCPMLITFDDGWRDNLEYALPLLKEHGVSAVLFVATQSIGRHEGFWQEELVDQILTGGGGTREERLRAARALIAEYSAIPAPERAIALASAATKRRDMPRRMVDAADLMELARNGVAMGGHGHTHEPLTEIENPSAEISSSRKVLDELGLGGERPAFSFPHGRWSAELLRAVRAGGFGICFTSEKRLVPFAALRVGGMIGRIEMDFTSFRKRGKVDIPALAVSLLTLPH